MDDGGVKNRQSKAVKDGRNCELRVKEILENARKLKGRIEVEFGAVERKNRNRDPSDPLVIRYDLGNDCGKECLYYPDNDLIVRNKQTKKIICLISVKRSFRERGNGVAYWALKIRLLGKDFKYIVVSPDVDSELFDVNNPVAKNKWRVILTCETDGVFVIDKKNEDDKEKNKKVVYYEEGKFKVGNRYLVEFIDSLL